MVAFNALDLVLKALIPVWPKGLRKRAIERCRDWVIERLNGEDGLGAIYPAMANSVMMFDALGYPPERPERAIARKSVENLLVIKEQETYCQPCVSPVWDTALAAHALMEAGGEAAEAGTLEALKWLKPLQVLDVKGDWSEARPHVRPGGWAFQYRNDHYPDLDDTAVVAMAMTVRARSWAQGPATMKRSTAPWNGPWACSPRTAAGRRSTPTTPMTISTTSPSQTTAPCSIRPPWMWPRVAYRCWRNWANDRNLAPPEAGHRIPGAGTGS